MAIPRVLHQIWLGAASPGPRLLGWREGFRRLHPSWEMRLWTGPGDALELRAGPEVFHSALPEVLGRCCHVRQRANVWRLELLRALGGLYADLDVEWLRPVDDLLDGASALASGFREPWEARTQVCNAVIAAEPRHPWIEACVAEIARRDPGRHLSLGSSMISAVLPGVPGVRVAGQHQIRQRPREAFGEPVRGLTAVHHFYSVK